MKKKVTYAILAIGLQAASASLFGQNIPVTISKAIVYCEEKKSRVAVQFDRSLLSVVDEARFAVINAPDDIARKKATEDLNKLVTSITKLGGKDIVPELNVLVLNASKKAGESKSERLAHYSVKAMTAIKIDPLDTFQTTRKGDDLPNILHFELDSKESVDTSSSLGLLFEGVTKLPQLAPIQIDAGCAEKTLKLPDQSSIALLDESGRRRRDMIQKEDDVDKANLTVDFSLSGSRQTDDNESPINGSFALTYVPKHFTKLGAHGIYEFRPIFFDTKYSKTGKDTSLLTQIGTRFDHTFVIGDDGRRYASEIDRRQIFPGISMSVIGKLDIYRVFKVVDVIGEFRAGIPMNLFQNRTWRIRFEQSGGVSFGGNLRSPSNISRAISTSIGSSPSKYIARPFHLSELSIDIGQSSFFKLHFTGSYRRVYPTTAEPTLDQDDKIIGFGRGPRNYGKGKVTFDFGKFASPFFSFEKGRQSPGYVLIDNKFELGVTLKIKGKDR